MKVKEVVMLEFKVSKRVQKLAARSTLTMGELLLAHVI